MFLNRDQIIERLHTGSLVIDPLMEEVQVSNLGVDLRLGNQYYELKPRTRAEIDAFQYPPDRDKLASITSIRLGQRTIIHPGTLFVATNLEYIGLSEDLVGLLFGRSSLGRLGVIVHVSTVDPGFKGKLVLSVSNVGAMPIALYSGARIARLCLATVAPTKGYYKPLHPAGDITLRTPPQLSLDAEIRSLKDMLSKAEKLRAKPDVLKSLPSLLSSVLDAEGPGKGKALERFVMTLFQGVKGLKIIKTNARLKAEELDLIIANNIKSGFWGLAGSPIIVECKNWSRKVGAADISVLSENLKSISPDAKTGIVIAPKGITGTRGSDATLKVRELRRYGLYILVLDNSALQEVANGTPVTEVIERTYEQLIIK